MEGFASALAEINTTLDKMYYDTDLSDGLEGIRLKLDLVCDHLADTNKNSKRIADALEDLVQLKMQKK